MKKILVAGAAVIAISGSAQVLASELKGCGDAPESEWMSEADIEARAVGMGYEVRRIKVDEGCYEIYGIKDGKKVEAYLNPVSGERVESKSDD
jgi:hypothetical protein